jgi:aspartyl-tRNA(Asn)/glutamyl-tRNA(Gln) amidotransferase subunit A
MSLLREAERCIGNQKSLKTLNACMSSVTNEQVVLHNVREADSRKARGQSVTRRRIMLTSLGASKSSIDGKLLSIKDNMCTIDYPTTSASKILDGYQSPYPATVVTNLCNAGAVIVGKTNLDEFGMGYVLRAARDDG